MPDGAGPTRLSRGNIGQAVKTSEPFSRSAVYITARVYKCAGRLSLLEQRRDEPCLWQKYQLYVFDKGRKKWTSKFVVLSALSGLWLWSEN